MIVVAAPLIALIAVTSASLALQHNKQQERSVAKTASAVNAAAQQGLADAVNAETGVRGYAATGDPLFLAPYNLTLTRIAKDRATLRAAAVAEGDSRTEQTVEATTATEMAELAQLRSAVSAGASATALKPALESGKDTMDALRIQIAALDQGPVALQAARRADITRMESTINTVTIVGLTLGVLAGLVGVALFTSGISGRVAAAAANANRLGQGQTFTVILPRTTDMAQTPHDHGRPSIPPPAPAGDGPAGTAIRVLYIEDNPANINVVARFMKTRPGIRLQSVTNGQAGLEVATQEIPDLILLDLHLPGLHGDEVLRRLRANPATVGMPVAISRTVPAP